MRELDELIKKYEEIIPMLGGSVKNTYIRVVKDLKEVRGVREPEVKIVKLKEEDIERLVENIMKEEHTLPRRERERHSTQFAKSSFEPYDREREIMDAFGPYREDIPANVVSYLRKNPRRFLQKLTAVYGMDRMLEYIGYEDNQNLDLDPDINI